MQGPAPPQQGMISILSQVSCDIFVINMVDRQLDLFGPLVGVRLQAGVRGGHLSVLSHAFVLPNVATKSAPRGSERRKPVTHEWP